jgi:hypothetical protein
MYVLLVWGFLNGIEADSFTTYDNELQCESAQHSIPRLLNEKGVRVQSMICLHTDKSVGSYWDADMDGTLKAVPLNKDGKINK